jgi:hypothetical protein
MQVGVDCLMLRVGMDGSFGQYPAVLFNGDVLGIGQGGSRGSLLYVRVEDGQTSISAHGYTNGGRAQQDGPVEH